MLEEHGKHSDNSMEGSVQLGKIWERRKQLHISFFGPFDALSFFLHFITFKDEAMHSYGIKSKMCKGACYERFPLYFLPPPHQDAQFPSSA